MLGIFLFCLAYVFHYFERKYVGLMVGWVALSGILDIIWMVFRA
jgi:hypothetical protein